MNYYLLVDEKPQRIVIKADSLDDAMELYMRGTENFEVNCEPISRERAIKEAQKLQDDIWCLDDIEPVPLTLGNYIVLSIKRFFKKW